MFSKNKLNEKKSPLKANPLNTAGQSIEEEINRIQTVEIGTYLSFSVCMLFFAFFEWFKWITSSPPSPLSVSIVALGFIGLSIKKIVKYRNEVKQLKLAMDGEKAVAEYLNRFMQKGYRIFNDIVVGDFNIDHLMIGETGIYTLETKTLRKYHRGNQIVKHDGKSIYVNGFELTRNPIIQAKAQANWVKNIVKEKFNFDIPVMPVVLFPGWMIDGKLGNDLWVIEPKALEKLLPRRKQILSKSLVQSISVSLSQLFRMKEKNLPF